MKIIYKNNTSDEQIQIEFEFDKNLPKYEAMVNFILERTVDTNGDAKQKIALAKILHDLKN